MHHHTRYKEAKKVTLLGAGINALLGVIKLWGGVLFHSHALVADAIHSFSDLVTDILVVFASKYGSQGADASHPYGHQRIETAATLLLSLFLIIAGGGIAWDALEEILHHQHDKPGVFALPIALFSILANEALFHYTRQIGKRIHSDLVIANAWHHRSDAASSVVVLFGLIGSLWGFLSFDALAAIIVSLTIIKMGFNYAWNSVKELIDSAVEPQSLAQIEQVIQSVDGVKKIHQLRSRSMGGDIYIDVHILVSPNISVSEGHFIAQHVHRDLVAQIERVKDVTVHVDPEDDEITSPSYALPNRRVLELTLLHQWQAAFPEIQHWVLHYLNGTLSIDLICAPKAEQNHELKERISDDLTKHPSITSIRLLSHTATLDILRAPKP
jgi:cation diffusion facilitator family transporter